MGEKAMLNQTWSAQGQLFAFLNKFNPVLQAVPVAYIAPRGADIFDLGLTPVTLDLLPGGALAWFLLPTHLDSVSYISALNSQIC